MGVAEPARSAQDRCARLVPTLGVSKLLAVFRGALLGRGCERGARVALGAMVGVAFVFVVVKVVVGFGMWCVHVLLFFGAMN